MVIMAIEMKEKINIKSLRSSRIFRFWNTNTSLKEIKKKATHLQHYA